MDMIAWDENLATGVKEIDDEHMELIECYNRLSGEYMSGSKHNDVNELLRSLVAHTKSHFQHEEALMDKAAYPAAASHKEEHHVLLQSVSMILNRTGSEEHRPLGNYSLSFLRSWLVNHILDADKELARFLLRPVQSQASEVAPLPAEVVTNPGNWSETHFI